MRFRITRNEEVIELCSMNAALKKEIASGTLSNLSLKDSLRAF